MDRLMKLQMLMLMLMLIMVQISPGNSENSNTLAPALYVFGDSLVDSGNNNLLLTMSKSNYPPYGMNFDKGPTGRFTNGRTVVDFIAEFLGLPYAIPYLSSEGKNNADHLQALNFASAACGILPESGNNYGVCLNLPEQVNFFENVVKESLPKHYNSTNGELTNYLSKSMFVVSIGNNDYINNYLDKDHHNSSLQYSPESFATLLVDKLNEQLQKLYKLGARSVITFEVGPIGCMPSIRRQFNHNGTCVEDINQMIKIFNKKLATMLQSLTSTLKGSSFILGRDHKLAYETIMNPSKYGLTDSANPCCFTWNNGTLTCIPELFPLACDHPEKHCFFDGFHLTEPIYKTVATLCFNGSSLCIPSNIQQLLSRP